jgi:hypothetical protein
MSVRPRERPVRVLPGSRRFAVGVTTLALAATGASTGTTVKLVNIVSFP